MSNTLQDAYIYIEECLNEFKYDSGNLDLIIQKLEKTKQILSTKISDSDGQTPKRNSN